MPVQGDKLRLLIVEDNVVISNNYEEFLTSLGHKVVGVVVSGEEAVQAAKQKRPDLILMDIGLDRDMDGRRAAELILEHNASARFLFMTGLGDIDTMAELGRFEHCKVMTKPVPCKDLQKAVEEFLKTGFSQQA